MSENTPASPELPPAGWYPDPHDATGQRYWNGAQWTEHSAGPATATAPAAVAATAAFTPASVDAAMAGGAIPVPAKRGLPKLKWWQWVLIAFGALVLVSMIAGAIGGGRASSDAQSTRSTADGGGTPAEAVAPTEKPVEMVQVPDLVGSTIADARTKLEAVGLVLVTSEAGDDWIVTAQVPAQGSHPLEGIELSVIAEAPKPVFTLAQQNAIGKAKSYLAYSGFSRSGLIGQLEYEGYSTDEATFGADNAGADWNVEAAEKAASYLQYSSFSRQGLYDQLAYEGFSDAEIQFGLAAVGY